MTAAQPQQKATGTFARPKVDSKISQGVHFERLAPNICVTWRGCFYRQQQVTLRFRGRGGARTHPLKILEVRVFSISLLKKKPVNFQVLSSRTYLLAGRLFFLFFFLVSNIYTYLHIEPVSVFSKHMVYFNNSLYIHHENLTYILRYMKNTRKVAFCIKQNKRQDQEEQNNILYKMSWCPYSPLWMNSSM